MARGITATDQLEVFGVEVGDSENEICGIVFRRCLHVRGLSGVQRMISEARSGSKKSIASYCQGTYRQRCRDHFVRNLLA